MYAINTFLSSQFCEKAPEVVKTVGMSFAGIALAKSVVSLVSRLRFSLLFHPRSDEESYSKPHSFFRLERRYDHIERIQRSKIENWLHKDPVQSIVEAVAEMDEYPERTGKPLGSMKKERLLELTSVLENALLGISIPLEDFNGVKAQQSSIDTLFSGDLLGYLANFIEKNLKMQLPSGLQATNLPTLSLYLNEASHYLTLRKALPESLQYDGNGSRMKAILRKGILTLEFFEWLEKNKAALSLQLEKTHADSEKDLVEDLCNRSHSQLNFLVSCMTAFHLNHQKTLSTKESIEDEKNQELAELQKKLDYQQEKFRKLHQLMPLIPQSHTT